MNPKISRERKSRAAHLVLLRAISAALLLGFACSARGFYPSFGLTPSTESAPYITFQPVSTTVFVGQTVQLSGSFIGTPGPSIQWRKDRVPIRGATSLALIISNVQFTDAGNYDFVATNSKGTATSQTATLTVLSPIAPVITTQPVSVIVAAGKFASFSVVATGLPAPSYQWRKDGFDLRGATQASLSIPSAQAVDAGDYDVVVTNSGGAVTSDKATLTIGVPPTVAILQPSSALINWGALITFDFGALGQNVRYQWKKNGVAIPGATNHSYTVSSATAADMGFYSAVAAGDGGTIESDIATLTIDSMDFWSFTTFAGRADNAGNIDGTADTARFKGPNGLALDRAGNLYVADSGNHSLRKITPDGNVSTIATGLDTPDGVAIDQSGALFVADWGTHVINKITADGTIIVFAGHVGEAGSADGPTAIARFNHPAGIAFDPSGNLVVAENGNHTIRKITPGGAVTTLAGQATVIGTADGAGADARFNWPNGIAVDNRGVIYVADAHSSTIRRISPAGDVITFAGSPGGNNGLTGDATGRKAQFNLPYGIATDPAGNVYVADSARQTIRKISSSAEATTIAGTGGKAGTADGIGGDARFNDPYAIAIDRDGNLYVSDHNSCTVRKGVRQTGTSVPSRLVNLSTRGFVPAGGALTPGFTLRGNGAKQLVIRAAGPALAAFGVAGALGDPKLALVPAGSGTALLANDDWGNGPQPAALVLASNVVGAFPFTNGSKDAALLATLNPATNSSYSMPITSTSALASGIALAEIYDVDPLVDTVRLAAVSTLGFVGSGANALVPGFVVSGKEPKRLLLRAIGPGLTPLGVGGALADPQIAVISATQSFTVARNDNWGGDPSLADAFDRAGAFALDPTSKDAALIVRLPPGSYTVTVTGVGSTTGNALVEIYDLDP